MAAVAGPPPPPSPRWATRRPGRRPEWKLHAAIGHAKNALTWNYTGSLWEWINGEWELRYEVVRPERAWHTLSWPERKAFQEQVKKDLKEIH